MARRIGVTETLSLGQENITSRLPGKNQPALPLVTRRAALGEVGNTLNGGNNYVGLKKPVVQTTKVFKQPNNVIKKVVVKKENIPISNVAAKKITIPKPVPFKKQESVLNQKVQPALPKIVAPVEEAYSSKQLEGVVDADAADADDPMAVSEYIKDIFAYLREIEGKYALKQNFLLKSHSTPRMRSVLVNWIVEVNMNFKFLQETFHLTISILDRYLQVNSSVSRENLQLVGTAAMLIAAKYEEIYPPELGDFVYICDGSFTKKQILAMELDILKKLKFFLGKPLSLHFLRRYNKVANVQPEHHTLGKYLLEISLLEYDLCHIAPSLQAAAACCLAISILDEVEDPSTIWTNTLVHYTTYTYSQIKPVMANLAVGIQRQEKTKFTMVRKKYESTKLDKISLHQNLSGKLVQKLAESATIKK